MLLFCILHASHDIYKYFLKFLLDVRFFETNPNGDEAASFLHLLPTCTLSQQQTETKCSFPKTISYLIPAPTS